ncbi:uncharacterized protein DNG_07176 [Cephalotrichum gorgonifer]|uniref:Uncharacterized protein n=1 Tax=Cephalotrichum gorgonifer TaxID=2041049 RepID=A0AAE8N135_9PEZI|nr:uncharacterized protein DNG_07176 [Cephalotrichum gorgonifer]
MNSSKGLKILERLEKTYPEANASAVRLELWDPYFALVARLLSAGKPADAVKMIVKGFGALGFSITAYPPVGNLKRPQLKVERWGMMNEFVPWAFNNLSRAYEGLAPELCAPAKKYAQTAYSVAVGERESIGDVFLELL